jgi:hypothetical protein
VGVEASRGAKPGVVVGIRDAAGGLESAFGAASAQRGDIVLRGDSGLGLEQPVQVEAAESGVCGELGEARRFLATLDVATQLRHQRGSFFGGRGSIRAAAAASTKSSAFRVRRRVEEAEVFRACCARRTRRAAVHPGGLYGVDEAAVCAAVALGHRAKSRVVLDRCCVHRTEPRPWPAAAHPGPCSRIRRRSSRDFARTHGRTSPAE